MNFTLSNGKTIKVRELSWQQVSAGGDQAVCTGWGELVICDLFLCHNWVDARHTLDTSEETELQKHLDLEATLLCTQQGIDDREHARWRKAP